MFVTSFDKVSNGCSDDTSTKKRSFNDFISNNMDEKYPVSITSINASKKNYSYKDTLNVDEKLLSLSKQIDFSILNIKDAGNDQAKNQKLAVWKDVITSIIGLTKQFVDELNTSNESTNHTKVSHYRSFLGDLRSQLVD